jgi:hypothetical protein
MMRKSGESLAGSNKDLAWRGRRHVIEAPEAI